MTLADFLLARIAEDEDAAQAAGIDFYSASAPAVPENVVAHIVRHNPARVGDECEAKRRLVKGLQPHGELDDLYADEILGILALPYADHPDYHEGWKA